MLGALFYGGGGGGGKRDIHAYVADVHPPVAVTAMMKGEAFRRMASKQKVEYVRHTGTMYQQL